MAHLIDFVTEIAPEGVDLAALEALAGRVLAGEAVADGVALTVLTTGDGALRDLNRRFLGIDAPTDVLAFPEAAEAPLGEGEPPSLGEIAISVPNGRAAGGGAGARRRGRVVAPAGARPPPPVRLRARGGGRGSGPHAAPARSATWAT